MDRIARKIFPIDRYLYKRAVIVTSHWFIDREKQLDDIDVFPVPDRDTGTNIADTFRSITLESELENFKSISESSPVIADHIPVLSEGIGKSKIFTTKDFGIVTSRASENLIKLLMNPKKARS